MEIKDKKILECNYAKEGVKLNLAFDTESPNHKTDVANMIWILNDCFKELTKYLDEVNRGDK